MGPETVLAEHAPMLLHEIAYQPASGIAPAHVVSLRNMTKHKAHEMIIAERGVIPSAWDPKTEKGRRHWVQRYAHLTPSQYAAKMRETFARLRHEVVPPYMQDLLYKHAVSGHIMGFERFP